MNFLEAMRKVRDEGKKVRRTDIDADSVVYRDDEGVYRELYCGADVHFLILERDLDTFIDSTWEVEE